MSSEDKSAYWRLVSNMHKTATCPGHRGNDDETRPDRP
jgi:hypothetical protein